MKNKRIIIISILVVAIIIGIIVFWGVNKNKSNDQNEIEEQVAVKTNELYTKLSKTDEMTFTRTLDDNNKVTIIVKGDKAYKEQTLNGNTKKYILKDGDTYYLDEEEKKYYIYKNNDEISTEISEELEAVQEYSNVTGTEKIEGKNYDYEEFAEYQGLLLKKELTVTDISKAKTRLYYKNNKLVYIKTTAGNDEELLKVDISYDKVDDNYFNIPSDYSNGVED